MSSNVNSYASLAELKSLLGITDTTNDASMRKRLEAATRYIEKFCGRQFYVSSETRYFSGEGETYLDIDDLLTLTSIGEDDDGDWDYTDEAWETTDYILFPLNKYPKTYLETNSLNGDYSYFTKGLNNFKIVGVWGYGDGVSATPYVQDTTLSAAITSTTATTCTVTSATNLSAAMTILIDSEQMYISGVSSTTLTVERGINGTTAATHLISSQIYYYRFPMDVNNACLQIASRMWQTADSGKESESIGDYSYSIESSSFVRSSGTDKDLLIPYRKIRV
jgi:hypothetical protein